MKFLTTTLILLFAHAGASAEAHHQGTVSSVNLGVRYSSLLENRGVILYRDYQIDPIVAVFLFDDRLEFLGDSIGYRDFIYKDSLRLRTRLSAVTDKPLFPVHDSVRSATPDRPDSYEWSTRAELFLPAYDDHYAAEIDFAYAKDISQHHGNYFELQTKLKLYRARLPGVGSLIEPNLVTTVGWGDGAHNRYFYGEGANQPGFNSFSYGLWFAFPEEADRYYPIVQITHFEVLGDSRRNASFARGRDQGWLVSFIATVGLLE